MTYLVMIFGFIILVSLAGIVWVELDKKHFKNKSAKR